MLEELRDEIVVLLIRKTQGACYGLMRRRVYEKKRAQREMIIVAQRNLRKFMSHRDWPWFMIIQKTRPMIGVPNLEEELRLLEEKANEAYGHYQDQLTTKAELEQENINMDQELCQLKSKLTAEQGDLAGN